jgi:hypothetical protein
MSNVQFGGPLGTFRDSTLGVTVRARVMGSATFAFEPDDAFKTAARAAFVKHVAAELESALRAGKSFLGLDHTPEFTAAVARAVGAQLGVPVEIATLSFGVSEEDSEALIKATQAIAASRLAAHAANAAAAPPAPSAPAAHPCPRCGAPGAGKFCATCGGPMTVAAAPRDLAPPAGDFLTSGVNDAMGAGSRVTVPQGHCFVGFANGAIAINLQPGVHTTTQPVEKGAFIRVTGLPFALSNVVAGRGRLQFRGTWYIRDPIASFRAQQTITSDDFGIFTIVLGRSADRASPSARDERELCAETARVYVEDDDAIKGTMIVLESMR